MQNQPENSAQLCSQPTEVYSRVVGYYRPVQNWNAGKREEFRDRQTFKVDGEAATEMIYAPSLS